MYKKKSNFEKARGSMLIMHGNSFSRDPYILKKIEPYLEFELYHEYVNGKLCVYFFEDTSLSEADYLCRTIPKIMACVNYKNKGNILLKKYLPEFLPKFGKKWEEVFKDLVVDDDEYKDDPEKRDMPDDEEEETYSGYHAMEMPTRSFHEISTNGSYY